MYFVTWVRQGLRRGTVMVPEPDTLVPYVPGHAGLYHVTSPLSYTGNMGRGADNRGAWPAIPLFMITRLVMLHIIQAIPDSCHMGAILLKTGVERVGVTEWVE